MIKPWTSIICFDTTYLRILAWQSLQWKFEGLFFPTYQYAEETFYICCLCFTHLHHICLFRLKIHIYIILAFFRYFLDFLCYCSSISLVDINIQNNGFTPTVKSHYVTTNNLDPAFWEPYYTLKCVQIS